MNNNLNFKVGEILVRHGKVLKVSQITKGLMELKPYFNPNSSNDLTYTIQLENPKSAVIRRLTPKDQLNKLLKHYFSQASSTETLNSAEAKADLSANLLNETLKLIKILWLEKQTKGSVLPGGKLTLYQQALNQAGEEIAAIKNITPDAAKSLILMTLKNNNK